MLKPAPGRWPGSFTGLPTIVNGMPKLVPLTGMPVETDAETTPGTACDAREELLVERRDLRRDPSASSLGTGSEKVSRRSVLKPRSTCGHLRAGRGSPARPPTGASARARTPRRPARAAAGGARRRATRPPSFSVSLVFCRAACHAGTHPKSTPESRQAAKVNSEHRHAQAHVRLGRQRVLGHGAP